MLIGVDGSAQECRLAYAWQDLMSEGPVGFCMEDLMSEGHVGAVGFSMEEMMNEVVASSEGPVGFSMENLMSDLPVGFSTEEAMSTDGIRSDGCWSPTDCRSRSVRPQNSSTATDEPAGQHHQFPSSACEPQWLGAADRPRIRVDLNHQCPIGEAAPIRATPQTPESPSTSDDELCFPCDDVVSVQLEDFGPKIESLRAMVSQLSALALDSQRALVDQQNETDKNAIAAKKLQAQLREEARTAYATRLSETKAAEVMALEAKAKLLQVEKLLRAEKLVQEQLQRDSGRRTATYADQVLSSCRKLCEATNAAYSEQSVAPLHVLLRKWCAFATREVLGHGGGRVSLDMFPDEILICIALKLPGQWLQRLASTASFWRRLLHSESSGAQLWQACMRGRSPQPPPSAVGEEAAWRKAWFQSKAIDRNWHAPPCQSRLLHPLVVVLHCAKRTHADLQVGGK